jgi:hypothetical protein
MAPCRASLKGWSIHMEAGSPRGRVRLSAASQLAEILASLAVLITLVFLVVEVRQNTETTRAATYDRSIVALNDWRRTIALDPELTSLWATYSDNDLGEHDGGTDMRVQLLLHMLWGIYENSYYSNQRELLGESEWGRFETQICARYRFDPVRWGSGDSPDFPSRIPARDLLTEAFVTYVESSC